MIAQDATGCGLENALRSLQHDHVVGLAAWFIDARHHADQKHGADLFYVLARCISAEISRKPAFQSRLTVPRKPIEIIPHRMKCVFMRADFNGLIDHILTELLKALPL